MTKGLLPHVLEYIHKIYLLSTQHLIVRGSQNSKGGGGIIQISQKEKLFFSPIKNYALFGVISPCITLPCPFQKRPSSFLHFGKVENIHDAYLKKIFDFLRQTLICFRPLSPQAEYKEDDEHFAKHLQIYVRPLLRPKDPYYAQNTHPMSSKFHLTEWKSYFSQFTDKFFKIEEVEYLIHYVKFNMWPALFYVNSLCFPNIFECWC